MLDDLRARCHDLLVDVVRRYEVSEEVCGEYCIYEEVEIAERNARYMWKLEHKVERNLQAVEDYEKQKEPVKGILAW